MLRSEASAIETAGFLENKLALAAGGGILPIPSRSAGLELTPLLEGTNKLLVFGGGKGGGMFRPSAATAVAGDT